MQSRDRSVQHLVIRELSAIPSVLVERMGKTVPKHVSVKTPLAITWTARARVRPVIWALSAKINVPTERTAPIAVPYARARTALLVIT